VWFAAASWVPTRLWLLEPLCKALLPIVGVLDEVVPWVPLFTDDGKLNHAPIHGCVRCMQPQHADRATTPALG
jgi:hypothetical protein